MTAYTDTLARIREANAYELSGYADVTSPDSLTSPGAEWLDLVRTAFLEAAGNAEGEPIDDDRMHEDADAAVPIYTHARWQVFTDLAAYQVDIEDLASDSGEVDMTALAGLALYQVARTLLGALAAEVAEAIEADAESTDEDGEDA